MNEDEEWFYDTTGDIEDEEDPWDGLWIDKDGTVHEGDEEDQY